MDKVQIVYWSQTGNTELMASEIAEGVKAAGKTADLITVDSVDTAALLAAPGFALGCPAMGDEVLEEAEMEPFVASIEGSVIGKKIVLFGSYGWGSGQWMEDWVKRMQDAGAEIVTGEGIITNDAPDDEAKAKLQEAGKVLAGM